MTGAYLQTARPRLS